MEELDLDLALFNKRFEENTVERIFSHPKHKYTRALLNAIPKGGKERLKVPDVGELGSI